MNEKPVQIEIQITPEMTPAERVDAKLSLNPFKRRKQAAEHIAAMGVSLDQIHSSREFFLGRTEIMVAALSLEEARSK